MLEENALKYVDIIKELKNKYSETIEIYRGMEIDYIDNDKRNIFTKYPLDYVIGSIHLVVDENNKSYSFDGSADDLKETLKFYNNNVFVFNK
jgi:histidinol-phosphatase (PHP family)